MTVFTINKKSNYNRNLTTEAIVSDYNKVIEFLKEREAKPFFEDGHLVNVVFSVDWEKITEDTIEKAIFVKNSFNIYKIEKTLVK